VFATNLANFIYRVFVNLPRSTPSLRAAVLRGGKSHTYDTTWICDCLERSI